MKAPQSAAAPSIAHSVERSQWKLHQEPRAIVSQILSAEVCQTVDLDLPLREPYDIMMCPDVPQVSQSSQLGGSWPEVWK